MFKVCDSMVFEVGMPGFFSGGWLVVVGGCGCLAQQLLGLFMPGAAHERVQLDSRIVLHSRSLAANWEQLAGVGADFKAVALFVYLELECMIRH